jgi:hypothetical protein
MNTQTWSKEYTRTYTGSITEIVEALRQAHNAALALTSHKLSHGSGGRKWLQVESL